MGTVVQGEQEALCRFQASNWEGLVAVQREG
jgi:hypothetical protein